MVRSNERCHLFCGDNNLFRIESRNAIKEKNLPPGSKETNYDIYDAADDVAAIFVTINTPPFLTGKKVVVIKNIDGLPEPRRKAFIAYLDKIPEYMCLILETGKGASGNKFISSIAQRAKTTAFKKLKGYEAKDWAKRRLAGYKKSITNEALDLLLELKGSEDMAALSGEIEKLAIYKDKAERIEEADVAKLVGKSVTKGAFDLVDAISARNKSAAISITRDLTREGSKKSVPEIMGVMGWQLRRVWKAKMLMAKRHDADAISSELRISRFSRDRFFAQVERLGEEEIKNDFRLLVEADRMVKSGRGKPEFVLEELVLRLCG